MDARETQVRSMLSTAIVAMHARSRFDPAVVAIVGDEWTTVRGTWMPPWRRVGHGRAVACVQQSWVTRSHSVDLGLLPEAPRVRAGRAERGGGFRGCQRLAHSNVNSDL